MSTSTSAKGEQTPLLASTSQEFVDHFDARPFEKQKSCLTTAITIAIVIFIIFAATITSYIFLLIDISPDKSSSNLNNDGTQPSDQNFEQVQSSFVNLLQSAIDDGKLKLREKRSLRVEPVDKDSASYRHQSSIVQTDDGDEQADYGFIENQATKFLKNRGIIGIIDYNSTAQLSWLRESGCYILQEKASCNASRYRSADGFCNNFQNPRWGVAMTSFRRVLPANYSDDISDPRGGFETTLPTARDISVFVHRPVYRQDSKFTVMLAVWGQFIDHDITATALSRGPQGETIKCCQRGKTDPACFPVLLSDHDEYYQLYNLKCMEFVRSAAALRCSFGPREQMNQVSSFLDGSMVYGSTKPLIAQLRTFKDGFLDMSYTQDGRALLPYSKNPDDGCNQKVQLQKGKYCFLSGDSRANENTHLTSIHLILARQHNNVAKKLKKVNPHWDDEQIYQETRHIIASQIQHITYNEFLPNIFSEYVMNELKLYSEKKGYSTSYDANLDPTIANNFASAAFRFAHTLIPKLMKKLENDTSSPEYIEMHKMLLNPFDLYKGDLDAIIRGAMDTSIEKVDTYFTEELTRHLFEFGKTEKHRTNDRTKSARKSPGLDLVALNIQRGRDHGLPSYLQWREHCNLSSTPSFKILKPVFDEESFATISKIYKSVEDIDLYTGALAERPIPGGLLGPTLTCLISDQFHRLKFGDRYWYETDEQPQAFTPDQLDEIRKTSLAGIICENADNISDITPEVMKRANDENRRIPCSRILQPDFTSWKDSRKGKISNENSANENPWRWRKYEKAGYWDEYLMENNEFSSNPVLPEWASLWAKNRSSRISSVVGEESAYVNEMSNFSAFYREDAQLLCNITSQSPDIGIIFKNYDIIQAPRAIPMHLFQPKIISWRPNANDSLNTGFNITRDNNTSGVSFLGPIQLSNSSCFKLNPDCNYSSKIILGDMRPDKNLFETANTRMTDQCLILAPIFLHGYNLTHDEFYWQGGITILAKTSNHVKSSIVRARKKLVKFPQIEGLISSGEREVWNGTLPVIFNISSTLNWYKTGDTIAHPISWSGFYDERSIEGIFLIPEKLDDSSIRWYDGSFSFQLPAQLPDYFRQLIYINRVYSSVLVLTSDPSGIHLFDESVFGQIDDWVFAGSSRVILIGKFDRDGKFTWYGNASVNVGSVTFQFPPISS